MRYFWFLLLEPLSNLLIISYSVTLVYCFPHLWYQDVKTHHQPKNKQFQGLFLTWEQTNCWQRDHQQEDSLTSGQGEKTYSWVAVWFLNDAVGRVVEQGRLPCRRTYPQDLAEVTGADALAGVNVWTKCHFAEKDLLIIPNSIFPHYITCKQG